MKRAPRPFGDYLLIAPLGSGAMGEVHLAVPKAGGPHVVIKRLKPTAPERAEMYQQRFRLEAELAVAVDSRHVAKVYEAGSVGDQLYLVMEYIQGWSLRTVLTDLITCGDRLSVESAIDVIAGVLVGLDALHTAVDASGERRAIVHRDVAPKNVMLRKTNGTATLIDLGIAWSKNRDFETRAGVIVGTPGYMAPEQIMGEEIDHRADLFSAGLMLFEMLTLEPYIKAATTKELLTQTLRAQYRPVSSVRKDIPIGLDDVIQRSVALEASDRWQSADELLVALRRIVPERAPDIAMRTLFEQMRFDKLRSHVVDETASVELLEPTEPVMTHVLVRAPIPITRRRSYIPLALALAAVLAIAAVLVPSKPAELPAVPVVEPAEPAIPSVIPRARAELHEPPPVQQRIVTKRVRRAPERFESSPPTPIIPRQPTPSPDAQALFARCFILLKRKQGDEKRALEQLCAQIHHAVRATQSGHQPADLHQIERDLERYEGAK